MDDNNLETVSTVETVHVTEKKKNKLAEAEALFTGVG